MTRDPAAQEHTSISSDNPVAASVIAIDGPVASGKSAVGLQLSRDLGYRLVDTGMIYRALTWLALQRGISLEDAAALATMAKEARIELEQPDEHGRPIIRIEGTDVTGMLRDPVPA